MANATGWKRIADMLNVNERTVRRYMQLYKLPVKKTPTGKPILLESDLKRWLDVNRGERECSTSMSL